MVGNCENRVAIIYAKTAITIHVRKKIIVRNSARALLPMIIPVKSPMEWPLFFAESTKHPKSCTAPMKIVPKTTHSTAGSQPHITAIAGPTIGAAPATDVK